MINEGTENNQQQKGNKLYKKESSKRRIDTLSLFFGITAVITTIIHLKLVATLQTPKFIPNALPAAQAKSSTLPATLADTGANFSELATPAPPDCDIEWLCLLYNSGGRAVPPIRYKLEASRFLTSLFLHTSFRHLLGNILFLYFLLKMLKFFYPDWSIISSFAKSGLFGNILASYFNPNDLVVGLSPGVYGMLGMLIFKQIYLKKDQIGVLRRFKEISLETGDSGISFAEKNRQKRTWIFSSLIGAFVFLIGVYNPYSQIDVWSHIFGIALGFIYGFMQIFVLKKGRKARFKVSLIEFFVSSLILTAFGFVFWRKFESEELALAAALNMGCN